MHIYYITFELFVLTYTVHRMSLEGINAQERFQRTALHYAVRRKDTTVAYKLLAKGADPTLQTKNNKRTPAHKAAAVGDTEYVY